MILGVTGHRPNKVGGYSEEVSDLRTSLAIIELSALKPTQVLTGMALGWDQNIAEACIQLEIPFVAMIPFETQDSRWVEHSRTVYRELLSQAVEIRNCDPDDKGPSPWKFLHRNNCIVNQCDEMLALWNGQHPGGTAHCVSYANSKRKTVHNCWDRWFELRKVLEG